ncbi:MAG: GTPase Era [Flavobacteriia bacterium]|nr:GTPase Era [Flavobacteriia bacterium]
MIHKAGYVNIVGSPNVGKSTLMNQLLGEKLSIVTSKAQTTRHRILGIYNDEGHQIVFSDTPGVVNAAYKLHENMMQYVQTSFQDADVLLFITDIYESEINHPETLEKIKKLKIPVLCLINKIDLGNQEQVLKRIQYWKEKLPNAEIFPISALHGFNKENVWEKIITLLPESPPYYDKEELSDRPLRFFVSEMIREKIFLFCDQEIPYSSHVEVTAFEEEDRLIKIYSQIFVERDSQKGILIGKEGKMLRKIGTEARRDIEKFLQKKVFLETLIKVDKDWRNSDSKLKKFGY